MTRRELGSVPCSIARTVDVLGDGWSWLIVRDLTAGMSRFDDLRRDLGISAKTLTARLRELEQNGVVEREAYQQNPPRHAYRLSAKGQDLLPVLMAMVAWGDRWQAGPEGPPMRFVHAGCGAAMAAACRCERCGREPARAQIEMAPGPGGHSAPGAALIGEYLTGAGSRTSRPDRDR